MKPYFLLLFLLGICCMSDLQAQDSDLHSIPEKSLAQIDQKISWLNKQLTKSSHAFLYDLLAGERRMQKKLSRIDSTAISRIFTSSIDFLNKLKAQLSGKLDKFQYLDLGEYDGYPDRLKSVLSFLNVSPELLGRTRLLADQSSEHIDALMAKLQYAEEIKDYIQERKQQLTAQLGQCTALAKELINLKQRAYYYSEQLRNYKGTFKDRRKAEAKAMEIVRKTLAFQSFMRKHSQLASLFNFQDDAVDVVGLQGLQTRTQMEGLLQQTIGSMLPAGSAAGSQMGGGRSRFEASFVDWKRRDTLYINAGFEENYKSGYAEVLVSQDVTWTKSALAGISKKYKINSKLNGNVTLLYDFL